MEVQIKTSRVQQEKHSHQNQYDRARRDFAGLDLCPPAKSRRQTEGSGIGCAIWIALAERTGVKNLVDNEEGDARKPADNAQSFAVAVVASAGPPQ